MDIDWWFIEFVIKIKCVCGNTANYLFDNDEKDVETCACGRSYRIKNKLEVIQVTGLDLLKAKFDANQTK